MRRLLLAVGLLLTGAACQPDPYLLYIPPDGADDQGADADGAPGDGLAEAGFSTDEAELTYVPDNRLDIEGDNAETFLKMIDLLEDLDDVQSVHHNADISDDELARILG